MNRAASMAGGTVAYEGRGQKAVNVASSKYTTARGLLTSRETAVRAIWNTMRPFAYAAIAVGAAWFGIVLVTQGSLNALVLIMFSFFAVVFAIVGIGRDIDRRRKLKSWVTETDISKAVNGAEDARRLALLAPPWYQAAYYARREELRRLPLPKQSLRALRARPAACKDDEFTFTGCCGPR